MSASLSAADLCFINRVAALKFAGGEPAGVDRTALDRALAASIDGPVTSGRYARVANLVAALLQGRVFTTATLQTALLVLHCSLSLDGIQLLAPQGVVAGMIRDVAAAGDTGGLARWLEDRAVPSSADG